MYNKYYSLIMSGCDWIIVLQAMLYKYVLLCSLIDVAANCLGAHSSVSDLEMELGGCGF